MIVDNIGILKAKRIDGETRNVVEKVIHYDEQDFLDVESLNGRLAILELLAKRLPGGKTRFGNATFTKENPYSPIVAANSPYPLEFDTEARKSNDVRIYPHHSLNAFRVGVAGVYQITASWYISFDPAGTLASCRLSLHKNGSLYFNTNDSEPVIAYNLLGSNAFHHEITMQLSKLVDLEPSDIFQICLTHNKTGGFTIDDDHGGWLDIALVENV